MVPLKMLSASCDMAPEYQKMMSHLVSTAEGLQLCYTNHPVVVISVICSVCIIVDRC